MQPFLNDSYQKLYNKYCNKFENETKKVCSYIVQNPVLLLHTDFTPTPDLFIPTPT